jgi:hypothetical protein
MKTIRNKIIKIKILIFRTKDKLTEISRTR